MRRILPILLFVFLSCALTLLSGCPVDGDEPGFPGQDIRITFAHTTDSHSKVLPFNYVPSATDLNVLGIRECVDHLQFCQQALAGAGELQVSGESNVDGGGAVAQSGDAIDLGPDDSLDNLYCQAVYSAQNQDVYDPEGLCPDLCNFDESNGGPRRDYDDEALEAKEQDCRNCLVDLEPVRKCKEFYGGVARVAWVINKIRRQYPRVLHVDSGDYFQGAPIFNLFKGEVEVRALSAMGVDIATIGNHEFDNGAAIMANMLYRYANFPLLNANYIWADPSQTDDRHHLGNLVQPMIVKQLDGLRVGFIGLGNLHSMTSIANADNSSHIMAMDTIQAVSDYLPFVEDHADLVVLISHLGVHPDLELASQVDGIDIIFGGHDHTVIMPPARIRTPNGGTTLVVHSGVNYKLVGQLDVVVRDGVIRGHEYKVIPIDGSEDPENEIGEDPIVKNVVDEYEFLLNRAQDLDRIVAIANGPFPRQSDGDSALGNLVTDSMRLRERVEADFAITNSLGIRANIDAGEVSLGKIYEVFPFENTLVTMYLSGREIKDLFDFIASRSSSYGCKTQAQVSGVRCVLDCQTGRAESVSINGNVIVENYTLVDASAVYLVATNDYIANGGSGFDVLEMNTTKQNTMLSLRDVVVEYMESISPLDPTTDGRIQLLQ